MQSVDVDFALLHMTYLHLVTHLYSSLLNANTSPSRFGSPLPNSSGVAFHISATCGVLMSLEILYSVISL